MYYSELKQRMEFCKAEGYYSMGFAEKSRIIMQFANEKRVMQKEKNKRRNQKWSVL